MRVLVTIANYGTKNDCYLRRLLQEYGSMPYAVDVVVLSNLPKDLGDGIKVMVEAPKGNPWSFPFAHKKILADGIHEYDLFIYSEDDTLITRTNIEAFLQATELLHDDEVAGFLRSETSPEGSCYFSSVHASFHWDPNSVVRRGGQTFAFFSNHHSASYMLTRDQLSRALSSGGYLVPPHESNYDLLVTAATDPYTQCGLRKMICISRIEDFVLPHLPNKYVGKMGVQATEFYRQIRSLEAIARNAHPCTELLSSKEGFPHSNWAKSYSEPARPEISHLVSPDTRCLLSYGCGSGDMEHELVNKGIRVTAIPLDSVIGACAQAKGIEVIFADRKSALARLAGREFDCILLSNVLHLVADPEQLLSKLAELLPHGGRVIAVVPNLCQLSVTLRRLVRHSGFRNLGCYARSGVQLTSSRRLKKWFRDSGFEVQAVIPIVPPRARGAVRASGGLLAKWLASEIVMVGSNRRQWTGEKLHHQDEARQAHTKVAHSLMEEKVPLRISLLGASLENTGNMGVNVLAAGAIKCIVSRFPQAEISFLDYGKDPSIHLLRLGGREIQVPKMNIRFSKKLYLPNNIALLLLLAMLLKWIPSTSLRKWIIARNRWLRHIQEAEMTLSIAGGDSFSDTYGLVRLLYVSLPQVLTALMGKRLLLLPQTIGPFSGAFSKLVARYILRRADRVYARDYRSLEEVGVLLGRVETSAKCAFCHDVGFIVDPVAPPDLDTAGLPVRAESGAPLVGLNVSGLLFNGGYTHNNMFGLRADYKVLVYELIDFLIRQKEAVVLLIPHVFGTAGESDWVVCNQIWEALKDKYGPRLGVLRGTYDQSELKYIIGLCDFFVGSRMHACIAAVSQGVPAVSVAYSDKFVGVMETIGVESAVADARRLNEQAILAVVEQCFNRRVEIRRELLESMLRVKTSILSLFDTEVDPPAHQAALVGSGLSTTTGLV